MFDKKKFEALLYKNNIVKKHDKQVINDAYEILRNQVSNLAKFRHPNILTLIEPLEDHKANFIFVTEYVTACLNSVPSDLDDVVIQKGLLQISNALNFLHTTAKFIHLSVQPSSIFINDNSDWKLSGFGHIEPIETEEFFIPQYDPRMPNFVNINLNYTAPELVFDNKIYAASDIYSLGCVIYYLYNHGEKSILNCNSSSSYYKEEYAKFQRLLKQNNIKTIFKKIPDSLVEVLPTILARYPDQRITIDDFIHSGYFNNPLIKTMIFFDEFPTKTDDEKLIFLKSLVNLLPLFPTSILQKKILPILLELLNNPKVVTSLIQISLTIVLLIGDTLSQLTFHDKVFSTISNEKLLSTAEAQIVLLENLKILQKKVKNEEFKKLLIKLGEKTLDLKTNFQIQTKALESIEIFLESVDFPTIKNNIFPKICSIFSKTTSLTVKVQTIYSFNVLIERKGIDKFTINETLLPLLKSMKTRELKILEAILKVYSTSSQVLDEEQVVEHIIPQLWLLSISSTLTPKVYQDYNDVINRISQKIQLDHMNKLKSLEGSKPNDEEDDTEKFRHLLYGDEETSTAKPDRVGLRDMPLSPTVQHTGQSKPTKPLSLRPKKQQNKDLNFGSNANGKVPKVVQSLRNTPSLSDDYDTDQFEDFVSAPSSRNVTPNSAAQAQFPSAHNSGIAGNKNDRESTIDWSSEKSKIGGYGILQPTKGGSPGMSNSALNNPSNTLSNYSVNIGAGSVNNNGSAASLPPGFSSQLMQPSKKTSINSPNRSAGWNGNDSLI